MKNIFPRVLYPSRLSMRFERRIKSFVNNKNEVICSSKPTLERVLNDLLWGKKAIGKKNQNSNRKSGEDIFITIISLNVNRLNATIKRH